MAGVEWLDEGSKDGVPRSESKDMEFNGVDEEYAKSVSLASSISNIGNLIRCAPSLGIELRIRFYFHVYLVFTHIHTEARINIVGKNSK